MGKARPVRTKLEFHDYAGGGTDRHRQGKNVQPEVKRIPGDLLLSPQPARLKPDQKRGQPQRQRRQRDMHAHSQRKLRPGNN